MLNYDIRVIALDLDGTLLDSRKRLSDRNRAALQQAADSGIEIVPATGRFYKGMPDVIRELPFVRYVITINGAQVFDTVTGEPIYSADIPAEDAIEFFEALDELPVIYDCYQDGWGYMTGSMQEKAEEYISNVHSLKMVRELRSPVPELKAFLRKQGRPVQKMQLFTRDIPLRDRLVEELAERFPQYAVTTSLPNNIEFNSLDADKGKAIHALASHLHLDISQIMAFGDGLNDTPMIREAGIGVAMENGHELTKAAADLIAPDCDSDGVAVIIEELLQKGNSEMELYLKANDPAGLRPDEIENAVIMAIRNREAALEKEGKRLQKALILPPDFTRFHSNAGFITKVAYEYLSQKCVQVDIMPALGTHEAMSDAQIDAMFPGVPHDLFIVHDWRNDVVKLGEVPADFISDITEGLWKDPVSVEVNRRLMDESYDLIISPGQVVPHEVIGMSNHAKNLFVGTGGSDMINKSHMIGAVYGMERMMGRDYTPVRKLFDYGVEHFLSERPLLWMLTVTTAPGGKIRTHGLFIGEGRECLTEAVKLAQEKNIDFVEKSVKKCVVYLDPSEFRSTWLGNKAVYRTRMMMADEGELIILAPGVEHFGEDRENDRLIRKYGYRGRLHTLEEFEKPENQDLRDNMGAAAHLIHGSSDGRFSITYAVKNISKEEIEGVGYKAADYDTLAAVYDPEKLQYGYNTVNGEEIYFVPNPALGLWIARDRFEA